MATDATEKQHEFVRNLIAQKLQTHGEFNRLFWTTVSQAFVQLSTTEASVVITWLKLTTEPSMASMNPTIKKFIGGRAYAILVIKQAARDDRDLMMIIDRLGVQLCEFVETMSSHNMREAYPSRAVFDAAVEAFVAVEPKEEKDVNADNYAAVEPQYSIEMEYVEPMTAGYSTILELANELAAEWGAEVSERGTKLTTGGFAEAIFIDDQLFAIEVQNV